MNWSLLDWKTWFLIFENFELNPLEQVEEQNDEGSAVEDGLYIVKEIVQERVMFQTLK